MNAKALDKQRTHFIIAKQQATSNKQQATSNKQQATSNKQQATNSIKKLFIALTAIIMAFTLAACGGGGGGGGGMVAFAPTDGTTPLHNGGGNGGWGTGNQVGGGFGGEDFQNSNLLISQMAALSNVTNIRIDLVINGKAYPSIVADANTTMEVLPRIQIGDTVSGAAYIYVAGEPEPRIAQLDSTEIALTNTLRFKVPYKYSCLDFSGTQIASGTYFSRDGINLTPYTTANIAGWQCVQTGLIYNGSFVSGIRGDITLIPVAATGSGNGGSGNGGAGNGGTGTVYTFTCLDANGNQLLSGTYQAGSSIDLSSVTAANMAGWQCQQDGTMHSGNIITGLSGNVTLVAVLNSFSAEADTYELFATATTSTSAVITISEIQGTPSVVSSDSAVLVAGSPVATGAGTYTLSVNIANTQANAQVGGPVWFTDNYQPYVTITDSSTGDSKRINFTLKNKYSLEVGLTYPDNYGGYTSSVWNASTTFNAGDTFDLSTISFSSVPAGRQIVAYKHIHPDTTATTIYKTTTTPQDTFTFSSALGRRNVYLSAVLDFTCSRSDGGYGTTASPLSSQNGTSTNPYLLNYYGNDTNKRNQIELEISDNNCADSALTIEPAPAQPAIVNTTFVITHTGNKFLIKINPALAESYVYTSNTIKLTITDPATGAKKDIHVLIKKNQIGSKPAPDAVGDIVFNDGSAMPYSEFTTFDTDGKNALKPYAIALIFYKGTDCNNDGDTTVRTLGVGLKHDRNGCAWCENYADACSKKITTIQCTPNGSAGAYTFSGDKDGSDNFSQIAAFAGVNDTGTERSYPAFYFAKNYKGQKLGSESSSRIPAGSPFEDGWYLPSIAELFQIYACQEDSTNGFDIDTASNALGGNSFVNSDYWSSSQDASGGNGAYYGFSDGDYNTRVKYSNTLKVCAIRAF